MKRKHIYLGGTVLLALLGALGGYFLLTGGREDAAHSKGPEAEASADAEQIVPIEVPPIEDEAFTVPSVPPTDSPPPRYASGGGHFQGTKDYPPEAGGASALPATPPPAVDATGNGMQPDEVAEGSDPYGATKPAHETSEPEPQQAPDLVTRGQEPDTAEATPSDSDNPLRLDARAAFGGDPGADEATGSAAGRYQTEDDPRGESASAHTDEYAATPVLPADLPSDNPPIEPAEGSGQQDSTVADKGFDTLRGASAPAPMAMAARQEASPLQASPTTPVEFPQETAEDIDAARTGESAYAQDQASPYAVVPDTSTATTSQIYDGPAADSALDALQAQASPDAFAKTNGTETAGIGAAAAGGTGTGRPGEPALEGPQAPQISIEKLAPAEIQVGKNCKFQIVVRNVGSVPARDVRLADEVPLGTQLVGAIPRPAVAGSRLEWELGILAPGDEETVEVELLPTEEGEIGSVASVQFAAAASVRTRCTRPQLEVRAEVEPTVMIGQQQVVRITLRNPGSGDATGVMLFENVPQGMSHPHGRALEFEVGTLRAGESRELELVLTAEKKGIVQNEIVARGDASLIAEDLTEFEVVAPEISVSVVGPQRKYLELPATFTVAIENPGTAAAKDVELVSKLPEGLEFVSADNYGQYDAASRSVFWSLAELPPKDRGEVQLVALPVSLGEQRVKVQAGADLGLADQAESAVQVEGLAAIKFEVTDVADPVEIGSETTYEIRVVNQGSKAATNLQVVAHFPEGIQPVRAEGPGSVTTDVQPRQVVFSALRQLSTKADTTYRIVAKGTQPGDQRVLVKIMTDDLEQPVNKEESTRVYADR